MILSLKHKFLFIHIYKTAGTSITRYFLDRGIGEENKLGDMPVNPHMRAWQVHEIFGRAFFEKLFSFAFVRNPWDYEYSLYRYVLRRPDHERYAEFSKFQNFSHYVKFCYYRSLEIGAHPYFCDQKPFLCAADGALLVDFVGRFERLEADFATVCGRIGLVPPRALTHENRSTAGDYQHVYTKETMEYVAAMRKDDIAFFGYTFV